MDDTTPTALDLVSTEELINILMSRCTNALFIGLKPEEYSPDNYWYELKGDRIMCLGLHQEIAGILEIWRKNNVSTSKDEESD